MITVIGGSGFIGTNLCKQLEASDVAFEIVDLKQSRSFPGKTKIADIRDYAALEQAVAGDRIIHLAAVHRDDVQPLSLYAETNVQGTQNVCRVAEAKQIEEIIFTSSVAVYGFAPADTGEEGKINPFNEYGITKFQGEEVLREWQSKASETRALSIVRPTVVFGEGNRGNVYNLLRQIQSGKFLMIGKGENRKSMAYVGNIIAFLEFMLGSGPGVRVYNYVDKPDLDMSTLVSQVRSTIKGEAGVGPRLPEFVGYTIGALADVVSAVRGRPLPVSRIRVKKFVSTTAFASAAPTSGFQAPYTLSEGLERTLTAEFINLDSNMETFETE